MAKVITRVPALTGGVSQQPVNLRLPTQLESADNVLCMGDRGLIDRPGAEFLGTLDSLDTDLDANDEAAFHIIDKDSGERWLIVAAPAEDQPLRVFDLTSKTGDAFDEQDVVITKTVDNYLFGATKDDLEFLTVGDVTYILNKAVTAIMDPDEKTPTRNPSAVLFVRGTLGAQNENVVVKLDGVASSEISCSGSESDTQDLAEQIIATLSGAAVGPTACTVNRAQNRIDDTGTSVLVGDAVKFSLSAGSSYAYYMPPFDPGQAAFGIIQSPVKITAEQTFFVVEVDTDWFRVAAEPGGDPIALVENGTNVQFVRQPRGTGSYTDFNFVRNGNVIHITRDDGADFTINVTDGGGDSLVSVYKETSATFAELPAVAPHGFTLKIDGSESNSFDNFYVRFEADSGPGAFGNGVWSEYVKEDIEKRFLNGRMPVIGVRESDGSFTFKEANGLLGGNCGFSSGSDEVTINHGGGGKLFEEDDEVFFTDLTGALGGTTFFTEGTVYYVKEVSVSASQQTIQLAATAGGAAINFDAQWTGGNLWKYKHETLAWGEREVGDELTNPDPSFIGKTINSLVYFKNRLGVLSGSSIVLSEAGEPFNFFRVTVQDVLPSAPVDVNTTHQEVSELRTAESINDNLMVMSDRTVYALRAVNGGVTPDTASLDVVGSFKLTPEKPVVMGSTLMFPFPNGQYSGVYEFFFAPDSERRFLTYETTEQCKRYIEGTPTWMNGLPNEGILAVQTDNSQSTLYLYTSTTRGNEKLQSSWQRATFDTGDIMYFKFVDTALYLVMRRPGDGGPQDRDWTVEVLYFDEDRTDGSMDYSIKLDRKTQVTPTSGDYDEPTDLTTVDSTLR